MSDADAPIACTLDGPSFKDRAAMISALFRRSLRSARREGLRLHLTFTPAARGDVEELVRLERACCAFLTFDIHDEAGVVALTITAPSVASAQDLLSPFSDAATAARQSGCCCS